MSISKETLLIIFLFLGYAAGDVYFAREAHKKLDKCIEESDKWSKAAIFRIAHAETRIDSIKAQNKALGESVIYVDSVATTKTGKAERAERRGRFVGGLLKGLIPGL